MTETQLLRVGKISSFSFEKGTAKVTYEDKAGSTTAEVPFLAWEFWMPKVGDQVLVGHLSSGSSRAVILGPFWYDGHRPHNGREGLYRKEYTNEIGGDSEEYDAKAASLTIQAGGCTIVLQGGAISITAPNGVTVNGDVAVNGKVAVTADVTAGSISLQKHTHTAPHYEGETTVPH